MGTQHTRGMAEKALAYVKDKLGIPPDDKNRMTVRMAPQDVPGSDDSSDPEEYTYKSIAEVYVEKARRELHC
jgi:hypothetical protein